MIYINVGAFINGERAVSKKAVREALESDPDSVEFDCTELLTAFRGAVFSPEEIQPDWRLTVVGPDPYTRRNFYGTVSRSPDGVYKVQ